MNRRYWLLSLVVCALATQMAPSWATDPEVVKIGFARPLTGKITFDPYGDLIKPPYTLFQVKQGQ